MFIYLAFYILSMILSAVGIAVVHLSVALIGAVFSVFLGLGLLNRVTGSVDEWTELKEGNAAAGIMFAGVIFSVLIMITPVISSSAGIIQKFTPVVLFLLDLLIALVNIFLAALISTFMLYLGFMIVDRLTFDINELMELKKGNTAVALMISAILIGISFVAAGFIAEMVSAIGLLGLAT